MWVRQYSEDEMNYVPRSADPWSVIVMLLLIALMAYMWQTEAKRP